MEFRLRGGSWASVFEGFDLAYLAPVSEVASCAREAQRAEPPSAEGRAVYVTQYVEFLTKSEATGGAGGERALQRGRGRGGQAEQPHAEVRALGAQERS